MSLKNKEIIFEQAFSRGEVQLIEESVLPGGQYKCVFRAKLQEADVVNNNKRVYPAETLQQVYVQLKEKATSRKLIGELDHPQPQGDQASKVKRSSTISLEQACFLIRELEWDGNAIYGTCETLSNRAGMDLYALLKDQVTVGFSLRAFGETRRRPDGITEVLAKGLKALTYDCVSNPSHDSSVILNMLQESEDANELVRDLKTNILEESEKISERKQAGLIEEADLTNQLSENIGGKVCIGNICSIAPLEEAVDYILDQMIVNTSIPKIKVNKL
jgi:hypothetical protein